MEPTPKLIDDIERSKVEQACRMTPEQRFLSGFELFDLSRLFMIAGIRMQHPDADEQEVRRLFRQRLDIAKSLENHNEAAYRRTLESLSNVADRGAAG